MAGISLIVGLGNPGAEYAETRHNAGFRFLAALHPSLRSEPRFSALAERVSIAARDVWLLAPQTYYNLSGDAVSKLSRYYKIPPEEVLVVHDDLDLPPGTVRLKKGGGTGGNNGLSDVIEKLGTPDFHRLRVGIGHPGRASEVVSYVLKRAPKDEQALIDDAMERARGVLPDIVAGEFQRAMNQLHTKQNSGSEG